MIQFSATIFVTKSLFVGWSINVIYYVQIVTILLGSTWLCIAVSRIRLMTSLCFAERVANFSSFLLNTDPFRCLCSSTAFSWTIFPVCLFPMVFRFISCINWWFCILVVVSWILVTVKNYLRKIWVWIDLPLCRQLSK